MRVTLGKSYHECRDMPFAWQPTCCFRYPYPLQELDVSGNEITALPDSLALLPKLEVRHWVACR